MRVGDAEMGEDDALCFPPPRLDFLRSWVLPMRMGSTGFLRDLIDPDSEAVSCGVGAEVSCISGTSEAFVVSTSILSDEREDAEDNNEGRGWKTCRNVFHSV